MAHPLINYFSGFDGHFENSRCPPIKDLGSPPVGNSVNTCKFHLARDAQSLTRRRNRHLCIRWHYRTDHGFPSVRNHDMICALRLKWNMITGVGRQFLRTNTCRYDDLRAFHNALAGSYSCQTATRDLKARCLGSNKFTAALSDQFGDRLAVGSNI